MRIRYGQSAMRMTLRAQRYILRMRSYARSITCTALPTCSFTDGNTQTHAAMLMQFHADGDAQSQAAMLMQFHADSDAQPHAVMHMQFYADGDTKTQAVMHMQVT
ncbi:hypothetical protein AMTR_s00051p00215730 [Amborella trichopoda]|uniref:Uncharacterized protein n=1 Tax=Amborella trichopoda TaxID=13333 RepID=U5D5J4_AMBTC|nr:hypothetical protein AMTR_s00051p00215730 [Amborella trichopoda]